MVDSRRIKNGALKVLSFAVRTYLDPNCTEFTNGLLVDAISLLLKDTKAAMHGNPAAREHLHNAAALVGAALWQCVGHCDNGSAQFSHQ